MAIRRDAADVFFSKCVRKRDMRCVVCGNTENLQAMHIIPRREKSVRWDGMNAITGCAACHRRYTENPLDWVRFLERYFGEAHLEILREKRQHKLKTTAALRKEIAAHYREQWKNMQPGDEFESWM